MDSSQFNSIATSGKSAATTVATALSSPRAVAKPKDATAPNSNSTNAASSSDITSDDFLTLLLLSGHPCVRLKAVTVMPGSCRSIRTRS